jgi:hypothetical protein
LVPGPAEEVDVIREIYRRYVDEHESMPKITETLNQRGVLNDNGSPWTRDMISGILTNPKYVGDNVTNRRSFKLRAKTVYNPPEMWVRCNGAFPAVVSPETFKKAQQVLAAHNREYTDDELLDLLKGLLSRAGVLTGALIDRAGGMPQSKTYQARFGGLLGAYRRIGYKPSQDYAHLAVGEALRASHLRRTAAMIADLERIGATVNRNAATDLITINDELRVRFLAVRCLGNERYGRRWFFRFDPLPACDITIFARMSQQNKTISDYFIVPSCEELGSQLYSGAPMSALNIYRFDDLSVLKTLISRTPFAEE